MLNLPFRYKGGPALPRQMISAGIQKTLSVEVYPLALKLIDSRDKSEIVIHISRKVSFLYLSSKFPVCEINLYIVSNHQCNVL